MMGTKERNFHPLPEDISLEELVPEDDVRTASEQRDSPVAELYEVPSVGNKALAEENAAKDDWISRDGRQRREQKGVWYQRKADFLASKTDPDSSPMKRRGSKGSHLGYYTHYVVDGGKARIMLNALVTPFEVTENQPMLDLLWRTSFRWHIHPWQVTGDTAYGTVENIAAVERAGIRASYRGGKGPTLLQQGGVRLRSRTRPLPMPGGQSLEAEDLQSRQKPDPLQDRNGYIATAAR
jgi:hypothetical protein